jgi:hypothetical protein
LKKDSPTCGLSRVKVYGTGGVPAKTGRGLFAEALASRFPLLPMEDEGRLNDPRLRENFVERIFAYRRLTTLFATRWSSGDVVRFHTAHKLALWLTRRRAIAAWADSWLRSSHSIGVNFGTAIRPNSWRPSAPSPRRAAGERAAAHARLSESSELSFIAASISS